MALELTNDGNPSLPSFWPSIASASAQLSRRRRAAGRVRFASPAVLGPASPGFVSHRRPNRSQAPKGALW